MAVFVYQGASDRDTPVRGTITADSPRQARELLRDQGIRVMSVKEPSLQGSWWDHWSPKIRKARQNWALAAQELSLLLTAGIPLVESLQTVSSQHSGYLKTSLQHLEDRVAAGASLAEAMELSSEVFDEATVRIVEVGENAGNLEVALAEIANLKAQLLEFKDKLLTALLYPMFLVVFGVIAMVFLMTWVLPPLLENLSETLPSLPWPTRVAKTLSDFLLAYGWLAATGLILATGVMVGFARSPSGKKIVDRWLLRIPYFGGLVLKQNVASAAMIVSLLSRSGVVLPVAIDLAARSTKNSVVQESLKQCVTDLREGQEISSSFLKTNVLPPLAIRFFAVGQESGQLDELLQKLANDYNKQVSTATSRITAMIEPALILVMAVLIGFLLVATILPILEAGNFAQQ